MQYSHNAYIPPFVYITLHQNNAYSCKLSLSVWLYTSQIVTSTVKSFPRSMLWHTSLPQQK